MNIFYYFTVLDSVLTMTYTFENEMNFVFRITKRDAENFKSSDGRLRVDSVCLDWYSTVDISLFHSMVVVSGISLKNNEDSWEIQFSLKANLITCHRKIIIISLKFCSGKVLYSGYLPNGLLSSQVDVELDFKSGKCSNSSYLYKLFYDFLVIILNYHYKEFKKVYLRKPNGLKLSLREFENSQDTPFTLKYIIVEVLDFFIFHACNKYVPELLPRLISDQIIANVSDNFNNWNEFLNSNKVASELICESNKLCSFLLLLHSKLISIFEKLENDGTVLLLPKPNFLNTKCLSDYKFLAYKSLVFKILSFRRDMNKIRRFCYLGDVNKKKIPGKLYLRAGTLKIKFKELISKKANFLILENKISGSIYIRIPSNLLNLEI